MSEVREHPSIRSLLTQAIKAAKAKGIEVVASAEPGVLCISTKVRERWIVQPNRDPGTKPTVSAIGALILHRQPEPPEVAVASLLACGQSAPWLMGFSAGLAGEPPYRSWQDHIAKLVIAEGYVMGQDFRVLLMTVVCEAHQRRHKKGTICPECSENFDTPLDPNAGPPGRTRTPSEHR